ncbi:outer membrane lipoprotein-sorting protein [Puniceicoccaceae bacterium K14]|nr:outer membrane lipoprotein-sorting protein [Puniceicoccaceae bacterium K14]
MAKSYRNMRVRLALFFALIFAVSIQSLTLALEVRNEPKTLDPSGEEPSQRLGWEILEQYRLVGVVKDFRFGFELKIMPRRGKTKTVSGLMLGKDDGYALTSRLDFVVPGIATDGVSNTLRLLFQNGISPYVWQSGGPENLMTGLMDSADYLNDLMESDVSTFELLMPFQFWQSFYYEGQTQFRSRKTHLFWMYPPKEDEALTEQLSGVRLYIDDKFHSMIRAEIFSTQKEHLKTLSLLDLKKVDGVWIPKELDVRNEKSRNKTRIKIVDAEVGLDLPDYFLSPESLADTVIGVSLESEILEGPASF